MISHERRLKYCVRRPIKNGIGAAAEYDDPSWPRYVRITDIANPRTLRDDTFKSLPPEKAQEAPFNVGDILAAAVGATFGKTYLHCRDIGPAAFAGYLVRISPSHDFDSRFVAYWSESRHYWDQVNTSVVQSTIQNFSAAKYEELRLPAPPFTIQRAVADYLDRETARLDGLVAAKERVLGLLAEKRRAIITRAVTRGIDPQTPLRDSGIPWIGEIPAHWETRRVAWLFRERDERGEPDLPLLEVSINAGVVLREFAEDRIESTAADFNTYKVAREGDIVFNKMRMWQGAVGVAPREGLVSPDYVVAAPTGPMSSGYAGLLFRTDMFSAECARRSHGIVWDRLRLYWEGFREIELPLPSPDTQAAIIAQVAKSTGKLDALRSATQRTIALLKERRAALITAAVTGWIDVGSAASGHRDGVE